MNTTPPADTLVLKRGDRTPEQAHEMHAQIMGLGEDIVRLSNLLQEAAQKLNEQYQRPV